MFKTKETLKTRKNEQAWFMCAFALGTEAGREGGREGGPGREKVQ